jgi:hypothetical protein
MPIGPLSIDVDPWVLQTPHNLMEALSQITLVRDCITCHQGSLPTPLFQTIASLAEGIEHLAHELTLVNAKNCILQAANKALSKCRRAKKNRIRQGGILTIEDAHDIMA